MPLFVDRLKRKPTHSKPPLLFGHIRITKKSPDSAVAFTVPMRTRRQAPNNVHVFIRVQMAMQLHLRKLASTGA